jgi:GT2 family glycosyltransferase
VGKMVGSIKNLVKSFLIEVQKRVAKSKITSLFDDEWYARTYLGDENKKDLAWDHYLKIGSSLGYDPSVYFDTDWYTYANPAVAKSGKNPFLHFLKVGWKQGLDPNPQFSVNHYLINNSDVNESGLNPLIHFSHFGYVEGRSPYPNSWPQNLIPWTLASTYIPEQVSPSQINEIAVLIPVFNNWHMTERCLRSIFRAKDASKFDVYIVNDGSTDNTLTQLDRYPMVKIINTPRNLGFTRACNFAFDALQEYKYLYLLNNDTEVQDGFVKYCLDVMESNPKAGLVGSALHLPDGTLQECGSIVWDDALTSYFGRGSKPSWMEFSFSRKVDYCSGAAILVKNEALKVVDFFDDIYAPAYYEDTDLAFKMRDAGYEVWCSSSSRVIHYEGITYGRDVKSETQELIDLNREKFLVKWADVLKNHPPSTTDNTQILKAAMRWSNFGGPACIMCSALA